jgi:hypothetical protein
MLLVSMDDGVTPLRYLPCGRLEVEGRAGFGWVELLETES